MLVYPAVDIAKGRCVRLLQGRPDDERVAAMRFFKSKLMTSLDEAIDQAISNHIWGDPQKTDDKSVSEVDRILSELMKH